MAYLEGFLGPVSGIRRREVEGEGDMNTYQPSRTRINLPEHVSTFQNTYQPSRTRTNLPEHVPTFQDTRQASKTQQTAGKTRHVKTIITFTCIGQKNRKTSWIMTVSMHARIYTT
ncbi:hypothetical protein Pmani_003240 [Petrolisthes manimaculis]|uniref:Uncharacterized protein n=1 Tax=Petrolisthes manimaculis TaxID=1843537 RepID=A0AAE1QG80_9EUCA|nr:hypothetical protein Pmani_003240 [Petrolisthes manimaculis]